MASGAIIIDPSDFLLIVCDQVINDWAATGTACELARVGAISTHTAGFRSHMFVLGVPQWTLTINVQAGSSSDNWLELCTTAFENELRPWSVSATRGAGSLFSTIIAGPTTEPPVTLSLDTQVTRSWVVGLGFEKGKRPTAGAFVVKSAFTKAEVQAYAP